VSAVRHLRIVPDNTRFGFIRFRRFSFPTSAVLSILALVLFFTHGLNYGIDFKGGISMQGTSISGKADAGAIKETLAPLNLGEVQVQEFGNAGQVLMRIALQPGGDPAQQATADKIKETLSKDYTFNGDQNSIQIIGPSVSQELVTVGTVGIFVAILCILIYLWFRFDWQFAVGAMIANIHDIVLTIGFMSVTQIEFDLTSVAALLTILGYSLNDTVVIYDRIRELLRKYKKKPMDELLDESINATLSRSVITHVTVALALLALLLFGGPAIHSFTATMLFGVVLVGTYTSIFIASPVLIYLGLRPGSHEAHAIDAKGRPLGAKAAE
jgi:preprotein translocase subunit SecF